MFKKTIIIFLYTLIFILIAALYLTYFGIETKRFNQAIKEIQLINPLTQEQKKF